MRTNDEDECSLPTSNNNEESIDLNKINNNLNKLKEKVLFDENISTEKIFNLNEIKRNKRKFLGSSSFLIKSKKQFQEKNNTNNKELDNININNNSDKEKQEENQWIEDDDAVNKNDLKDKEKYPILDDIIIKKSPTKSLKITYKRSHKDQKVVSSSEYKNENNITTSKKIKLSVNFLNYQNQIEIINFVKEISKKIEEKPQHRNKNNIIVKEQNINTLNSLLKNEIKNNDELFDIIAAKKNLISQKKGLIGGKETLNSLNDKNSIQQKEISLKELILLNNKKQNEKENSQHNNNNNSNNLVVSEQKENISLKKPSLSLTKLKRKLSIEDSYRTTAPKRLKDILNFENNNSNISTSKKILNDMSVYDRRSAAFGMDNIGERTNISNGLLSRISNDDNSSNQNQYYSSSSNLNGQQQQHQQQQPTTIATLCNIGNTCYLNSVVYTLRFAPLFLHNLHHLVDDLSSVNQNIIKYRAKSSSLGRNVSGLHIENARSWSSKDLASLESNSILTGGNNGIGGGIGLGSGIGNFGGSGSGGGSNNTSNICDNNQKSSQQIATEKLHELYQHLHRNEMNDSTEPFHADTFLHAIQDVSAIFEGNQQQDAHEFLMCVLDSIRETCQSLTKAITECPDVIANGYVGIPEQNNESSNKIAAATAATNANVILQPKEQISSSQINSNVSNTTNLIKTSFFSRKSKRKDEAKNSKNLRLQSKDLKENPPPIVSNFSVSLDSTDATANSNSAFPNNLLGTSILENDIGGSGKNKSSSSPTSQKDNTKERLAEKIKKLGLDFFSQYFEGITVSTTKCLSCETITEQKETMIDIAVPISGYENVDCSESFIQNSCITREYFRCENKYRCEQCTGYTEAIRSISYEVLPRLLIIQLSRFSGGMEKINSYLPTPFTLQCFCSQCCKASDNEKLHIYKLYSVITHVGATMSVGHYIAYTCALDWANEYFNCPKDRRRQQQQQQQQQNKLQNLSLSNKTSSSSSFGGGSNNNPHTNLSNGSNSSGSEKNMGLVKKLIYGRSKASSSGDMTKNMKNLNGISSSSTKDITNGIEKLKMGPTLCQGLNCCGIKLRQNNLNYLSNSLNNINNSGGGNGSASGSGGIGSINTSEVQSNFNDSYVNLIDDLTTNTNSNINSGHTSGYASMNGSRNYHHRHQQHQQQQQQNEPIWYMCDDDKIKAMTQREFEELLSPNRKIMITPYLLFYARKNLNNSDSTNDINSDYRNCSDE